MCKSVSKLDFFQFLENQSLLYNVQTSTSYSNNKYYTTYYYTDNKSNVVSLCYQDFDVLSNSVDYLLEC